MARAAAHARRPRSDAVRRPRQLLARHRAGRHHRHVRIDARRAALSCAGADPAGAVRGRRQSYLRSGARRRGAPWRSAMADGGGDRCRADRSDERRDRAARRPRLGADRPGSGARRGVRRQDACVRPAASVVQRIASGAGHQHVRQGFRFQSVEPDHRPPDHGDAGRAAVRAAGGDVLRYAVLLHPGAAELSQIRREPLPIRACRGCAR